jgi:hypothetical protein
MMPNAMRTSPLAIRAGMMVCTPPAWYIEMEKYPYDTQVWRDWLILVQAKAGPPLPESDEWLPWLAARSSITTTPKAEGK